MKQFNIYKKILLAISALLFTSNVFAKNGNAPLKSILENPLALTMVVIAAILALLIAILSNVLNGTAEWFRNNQKQNTLTTILILCMAPCVLIAQQNTNEVAQVASTIGGISNEIFYLLCAVIALEILVILMQLYFIKVFIAKEKIAAKPIIEKENKWSIWWHKANSFKPFEKEVELDLGHNYDGIRELDNNLPKWWLYGFYLTIFTGIIYLYRFHYTHTAPLSIEEYAISMKVAEEEKEKYLAKSANNVNENTVKLLTDIAAIEKGKTSFTTLCAACHGAEGQGGVGPNLTDAYWLHGGSVNDIFKVIKYGKPEKGMRSWQDDFSHIQIAQIASYIKTMQGTNPANAKEKQGELHVETNANANSTSDSITKKSVAIN